MGPSSEDCAWSQMPSRKKRRLDQSSSPCSSQHNLARLLAGCATPSIAVWQVVLREATRSFYAGYDNDVKSIHNILLIHLGYTLGRSGGNNNDTTELLLVQCACWRHILLGIPPRESLPGESLPLLTQILETYHENDSISVQCLEVANVLVSALPIRESHDKQEEGFLLSLLRFTLKSSKAAIAEKATSVLATAAMGSHVSRKRRIVYTSARLLTATDIMFENVHNDKDEELTLETRLRSLACNILREAYDQRGRKILETFPKEDLLMFLRCLSIASKAAVPLSQSEVMLEFLFSIATSDAESPSTLEHAAQCLSSIALAGGSGYLLADKLVALVCDGSSSVKHEAILGLYSFLQREPWSLNTQLPFLVASIDEMISHHGQDDQIDVNETGTESIAKLLSLIARLQVTNHPKWTESLEMCIQPLAFLLRCTTDSVVSVTLNCVLELSFLITLQRPIARERHLLFSIAHVAAKDFSSVDNKSIAIQILWNLSRDKTNLTILTRTSVVLEALVAVASAEASDTATRRYQTKRCALRTLLRLSEVVSNRRILAKRVGLLACLIRFTRSMTLEDAALLLPKEELKQHILKLATLI